MIGCTLAAVLGAPIEAPARLRPYVMPVIGVLLGSRVTADVLARAGEWSITFVILLPFLLTTAGLSYLFYRRIGGYDRTTAYFSAMPGGLTDMVLIGTEMGGEEKRIALAHASRVLIVICLIVISYKLLFDLGTQEAEAGFVALDVLSLSDWLILASCAVIGSVLATWLKIPLGQIMGPMLLSSAAHVTGIVTVPPPSLIVTIALIVIGTIIGCRFVGTTFRAVGRDLLLGAGSSLVMLAVAVAFASAVSRISGEDLSQTFLAFSPGGVTEMSLLALAMGQEVAYVTAAHLARIGFVIFGAAPIFALLRRLRG